MWQCRKIVPVLDAFSLTGSDAIAHDVRGYADGDGAGRQIVRDDGTRADDATIADCYSTEHGDPCA